MRVKMDEDIKFATLQQLLNHDWTGFYICKASTEATQIWYFHVSTATSLRKGLWNHLPKLWWKTWVLTPSHLSLLKSHPFPPVTTLWLPPVWKAWQHPPSVSLHESTYKYKSVAAARIKLRPVWGEVIRGLSGAMERCCLLWLELLTMFLLMSCNIVCLHGDPVSG